MMGYYWLLLLGTKSNLSCRFNQHSMLYCEKFWVLKLLKNIYFITRGVTSTTFSQQIIGG